MAHDPLRSRSIEIIRSGQAASGAYVAAPSFRVYRYAWLRDGAFVAHALDAAGERESAAAFHAWAARAVAGQGPRVDEVVAAVAAGRVPAADEMPPTRFTLEGAPEQPEGCVEPWSNFQLDGYGLWLWALERHLGGAPRAALRDGVEVAARYLAAAWRLRCWNCWEEWDGGEHAFTVGAAAAGLAAASRMLERDDLAAEARGAHALLLERFAHSDGLGRGTADPRADGSLLWLATPLGLLPPEDPRAVATVEAVRHELTAPGGGIRRYLGDTYYGGGEWLLLTCSLGWHDALHGRRAAAVAALEWTRAQAEPDGALPEQVLDHPQAPEKVEEWVEKWGSVASPLLWSHAMYLLLEAALAE